MRLSDDLRGKVALVTGGARNIGRAICRALAEEGVAVAVNARTSIADAKETVRMIEADGGRAAPVIADVTDEQQVEAMVHAVVSTFGRIDMLVNTSAVRREMAFADMSYAEWREVNSVILDGAFLCSRACAPEIAKAGGGSIVNIGGITAHTGAKARAHVVTAKSGLAGFTRALALDLMDDRITVNCVVPGRIRTIRIGDALPTVHAAGTVEPGDPEDVAAVVQFLCGRGARHITGQSIHVNGGQWMT